MLVDIELALLAQPKTVFFCLMLLFELSMLKAYFWETNKETNKELSTATSNADGRLNVYI